MTEHAFNGWTFKLRDDTEKPMPWVYEDVKNCGYNFATEISVEKIIVEVEKDGKIETLSLKFSDFESVHSDQPVGFLKQDLKTAKFSLSLSNFAVYKGEGLLIDLMTKKDVLPAKDAKGKPVDEPLYLFFTILFGVYGNDPPHEFTGALSAARFTPALRFETMNDSVKSIRVHYRFHFDLDSYLKSAPELTKQIEEAKKKFWGIKNYASLIRDADQFPSSLLPTIKLLKDLFVMSAELKFFNSLLDECGFDWGCEFNTSGLELEISDAGTQTGGRLDISYRDLRTLLTDPTKALEKSSASVTDKKVKALSVGSASEYNPSAVDELTKRAFDAIVGKKKLAQGVDTFAGQSLFILDEGTPLPGVTAECLNSNIKYLLVQLVIKNYRQRKAESILEQVRSVREKMSTDLADILKYLEPGDFEELLGDITGLIKALLQEPLVPVIGQLLVLKSVIELFESIQRLAGKIISIASFDAAEKPALYEAVGTYVRGGEVNDTWDNLHWWGTEEIPSAPGAFHAVHSHYRWTQLNTYPTAAQTEVLDALNAFIGTKGKLHLGAPQLRSLVKKFAANNLSGPLIDPHIPKQTISLALALNDGDLDRKLKEKDSTEPFEKVNLKPGNIATAGDFGNSGADIVYWLSCKAERTEKDIFQGTLLVNGFYFAHDEEKPFSLFRPANLFAPTQGVSLQKPKREEPYTDLIRDPSAR